MSAHSELDLGTPDSFDPLEPEEFDTAHTAYARVRGTCPVAHSQRYGGFWALFGYDDVSGVLSDPATFTTSVQNTVPRFAFTGRRPPLHFDPPEHSAYRRVINRFFTRAKMEAIAPTVRAIAATMMAELIGRGEFDVAVDYAQKFPAHVFAEFFHLDPALAETIKEISARYVAAIQVVDDENVVKLSRRLYEIGQLVIDERIAHPMDPAEDLTTALLEAEYEDKPLPRDMVLGCVRQLLVTGMVAPSVFIGCMFVHLARDRELQARLRSDPSLLPAAVEEFLRLYTPYRGMARTARRDVAFGDTVIREGEPIALVYMSANRDEKVFGDDAGEFRLDRENIKKHIAFGGGPHTCPGAPLARIMFQVTLEEALSRTSDFDLAGPIAMARWAEWGTNSVPLRVVPAPVPAGEA
uniref:cytochrome P450 n=1 Tax=Sinomonas susongensis TaxID=1324851 RepID=UPI001108F1DD|nr:cytochrome P450 [Sinomonas susongensis]